MINITKIRYEQRNYSTSIQLKFISITFITVYQPSAAKTEPVPDGSNQVTVLRECALPASKSHPDILEY